GPGSFGCFVTEQATPRRSLRTLGHTTNARARHRAVGMASLLYRCIAAPTAGSPPTRRLASAEGTVSELDQVVVERERGQSGAILVGVVDGSEDRHVLLGTDAKFGGNVSEVREPEPPRESLQGGHRHRKVWIVRAGRDELVGAFEQGPEDSVVAPGNLRERPCELEHGLPLI